MSALFHQRPYDMPSNFPLHYLEIRLYCFQEKQFQMVELITMNLFLTWSNIKKLTGFRMQFPSPSKVPNFWLYLGFRVCSCNKFNAGMYSAATFMAIPWPGDSSLLQSEAEKPVWDDQLIYLSQSWSQGNERSEDLELWRLRLHDISKKHKLGNSGVV